MLKKTLLRAGLGFLIGMFVGNLIAILTGGISPDSFIPMTPQLIGIAQGNTGVALALQTLFSGLYGAVCFAGISFYELERLPLAFATAAHGLSIVLLFIPIAHLLGWETGILDTLIMAGIQIIAFFIMWLIMNAIYKSQVKKLNEMQKDFLQKDDEKS